MCSSWYACVLVYMYVAVCQMWERGGEEIEGEQIVVLDMGRREVYKRQMCII